jgi:signal transduction histidine kinase
MKKTPARADLFREPDIDVPLEVTLRAALRRLITLTGARAGALAFGPARREPIVVTAARDRLPAALQEWLWRQVSEPTARGIRVSRVAAPGAARPVSLLIAALQPRGTLVLIGALKPGVLPPGLAPELGAALERAWRVADRVERTRLLTALARLGLSSEPLDAVYRAFAEAVNALVRFDSIGVSLVDLDRAGFTIVDLAARTLGLGAGRDGRMALAGTLLAEVVQRGIPVWVDDLTATTVPAASREAYAARGYRSALLVPLLSPGGVAGAVTLASHQRAAFSADDVEAVAELAQPLALAIEQRRLLDESRQQTEELRRGARETQALLEAGRAVTASLDVRQTIRVIMTQARNVLGVESCGVMTLDPATGDLRLVASLDLPAEMVDRVRLKPGEGIGGLAFAQRRPVQSEDLQQDERVSLRFRDLPSTTGFRSLLAVPLGGGERASGVIYVFRSDPHRFSEAEAQLLLAFADQAAIALEHARLYEQLEAMVAERTRELDTQKRFVEVVLEALPLGVIVLDGDLRVVSANRHGARVLGGGEPAGRRVIELLPAKPRAAVEALLRATFQRRQVATAEADMAVEGESKVFQFTAATIEPAAQHLVLLVEDVTLAKHLEQQMLLTERLTTAGRLAAGVAHELNNPLATIAGCAEALLARTREGETSSMAEIDDFRHYLGLVEEEAYRCKEITGSLLQFVREPGSLRALTDLNALVLKTVELLSHQSRFGGRRFLTELDPDLPSVTVNEGQVRQVFLGIAANGLEAMGAEGTLRIRSRRLRQEVEVEFEDEGPGIPDEIQGRIFDPFFTTKPPGQGTGLGLAIAQGIVTDHGGRIEVASRSGKGSTFRVVLPL